MFPGLAVGDEHEEARINAVERYVLDGGGFGLRAWG